MSDPVKMVGPDGREYELDLEAPGASVEAAQAKGFRLLGSEGRTAGELLKSGLSQAGETLTAAGAGALTGASAGVLKPFSQRVEETLTGRTRQQLDEEHGVAHGVGEFGGMLVSPINEVGLGVKGAVGATTVAGKIGAGILGGAATGALAGAGQAIGDAALGDEALTAQKLISSAGMGALLGGAGAGLVDSALEAGKVALPAIAKSLAGANSFLEDFANDRWLKASGGVQKEISKIPLERHQAVADVLRLHLGTSGDLEGALESVSRVREDEAQRLLQQAGIEAPGLTHAATAEEAREAVSKAATKARDVMTAETEAALQKQFGAGGIGGLTSGMSRDEAREALRQALRAEGQRMGGVLEAADKAGAAPDYAKFGQRLGDFLKDLNPAERKIIGGKVDEAFEFINEMSKTKSLKKGGFGALNDLKSTLQADINYKADSGELLRLRKALVGTLKDEIDAQFESTMGAKAGKEWQAAKKSFGLLARADDALGRASSTGVDAMRALADELGVSSPKFQAASRAEQLLSHASDAVSTKAAKGADAIARIAENGGAKDTTLRGFLDLGHAQELLKRGADRELGNRWLSPTDYLAGLGQAVMTGNPLGALSGLATSLGHKVLRERGSAIAGKLADKIAHSPSLMAIAQGFSKNSARLANLPAASAIRAAAAKGPAAMLAAHMVLARTSPEYAQQAQAAGFMPETGEQHGAALARAHSLAVVASAVAKHDAEIDRHVGAVVRGEGDAKPPSAEAHDKRVEQVQRLAANPEALAKHLAAKMSGLEGAAPNVTSQAAATVQRAVSYLSQAAAQSPKPGPLVAEWKQSEASKQSFARKYEAVTEPLSVLKKAAAGTVTSDEVQALRVVYPQLAREIETKLLDRVTDGKPMPYRARLGVAMLTGAAPDGTTAAAAIAANQATHRAAPRKQDAQGGPTPSRADKLTVASRFATRGERREMKEE